MGIADGAVVGLTQIVNNGPASKRMNIVLVAEGYQQAQLGKFADRAQQFVNRLFVTPPFDTMQAAFNIYRLDVSSDEAGANDPTSCGGTGKIPRTYFNASFCGNKIERLLLVTDSLVQDEVEKHILEWHLILVLVNSRKWGGSGGQIATTSHASGWENIAIHEMGHSVFGLADEYEYYAGCGAETTQNEYERAWAEPSQRNVTKKKECATIKWEGLGAGRDPDADDPQRRLHQMRSPAEPGRGRDGRSLRRRPILPLRHLPPRFQLHDAESQAVLRRVLATYSGHDGTVPGGGTAASLVRYSMLRTVLS